MKLAGPSDKLIIVMAGGGGALSQVENDFRSWSNLLDSDKAH